MQTEVYDEREIDHVTLTPEVDAEALALIAELGLGKQVNESGSRIAYPTPTEEQGFAIETIFAEATLLKDYDAGCIPLRVLKEIKKYRSENPDHPLVIRHTPPSKIKDPVLLAYVGPHSLGPSANYYICERQPEWKFFRLIARWGDGLDSWPALIAKATKIKTAERVEILRGMSAKIATEMKRLSDGGTWAQRGEPHISGVGD